MRCLRLAVGLLPLLAASCKTPIDLPGDFVRLGDSGEGFRAITSEDARVWVRDLWDGTEASVEFWAETLQNDLVQQRGYEFVGGGDVKNRAGITGRWLEFVANVDGEATGYCVALWVDGRWLQVVEFVARIEVFRARIDSVRAALASVH